MRQPIGLFHAKGENREDIVVIVSQEIKVNKDGVIVNSKKHFSLNNVDGEEVMKTNVPDRFVTKSGIELKKTSLIKDCTEELDLYSK